MKNSARFSKNRHFISMRDAGSLRITLCVMLYLTLLCCDKANSRNEDPALPKIVAALPLKPAPSQKSPLCKAVPTQNSGIMTVQELEGERNLTLAYRFEKGANEKNYPRYKFKSLYIRTSPEQISWHASLEEEIESWDGVILSDVNAGQIPRLSMGVASSVSVERSSALNGFREVMATSLSCLHTLYQWCESEQNGEPKAVYQLDIRIPGAPRAELRPQSEYTADVVVGASSFKLTATQDGPQWTGITALSPANPSVPKSRKQLIFRLLTDDASP